MGMPVKLSDALVQAARQEAALADRSLTAQIEHWAKLGRAAEAALKHSDARALKQSGGDLSTAFAGEATREAVRRILQQAVISDDRAAALARITVSGRPIYGTDPRFPGLIVRQEPDGTRMLGRLQDRRFIPEADAPAVE